MTIDEIYDVADEKMKAGQIEELDELLRLASFEGDTETLMSWATATLPVKSKLRWRRVILLQISSINGHEAIRGLE